MSDSGEGKLLDRFSPSQTLASTEILKPGMQSGSLTADGASDILRKVGLLISVLRQLCNLQKVGLNLQWELSKTKQQKAKKINRAACGLVPLKATPRLTFPF